MPVNEYVKIPMSDLQIGNIFKLDYAGSTFIVQNMYHLLIKYREIDKWNKPIGHARYLPESSNDVVILIREIIS